MKIIKKVHKTPENKIADGIKFMNQYKILGLNIQKTDRFSAHINSLKVKHKKNDKNYFPS
jgi:hypothetical protein